jgi:hypothetical protein
LRQRHASLNGFGNIVAKPEPQPNTRLLNHAVTEERACQNS